MGLDPIQFASLCLLTGAFSLFTFKVNIVMFEYDPVIMMLGGYFALVDGISSQSCCLLFLHFRVFCSGWYWFFLSIFGEKELL